MTNAVVEIDARKTPSDEIKRTLHMCGGTEPVSLLVVSIPVSNILSSVILHDSNKRNYNLLFITAKNSSFQNA